MDPNLTAADLSQSASGSNPADVVGGGALTGVERAGASFSDASIVARSSSSASTCSTSSRDRVNSRTSVASSSAANRVSIISNDEAAGGLQVIVSRVFCGLMLIKINGCTQPCMHACSAKKNNRPFWLWPALALGIG